MEIQNHIETFNTLGRNRQPFWFMVSFNTKQCVTFSPELAREKGVLFDFNGVKNFELEVKSLPKLRFTSKAVAFKCYEKAFNVVQSHLNRGNSYLVNLTFPSKIETNFTLEQIFQASTAKYKLLYKNEFVVFSPESFVTIKNGSIKTFPMKGTIDAALPDAMNLLIQNTKEQAEHATIVDLLRNDLSKIATDVHVSRFRYVDTIVSNQKTLLQVSSEITGHLPDKYHEHLGDILFDMLPAGSISGAPKKKTLEIIEEAETYDRGFYTGISGYFDGTNLDSCVLIRFIENTDDGLIYKSGGGITAQSNVLDEYQELTDKIYVPVN